MYPQGTEKFNKKFSSKHQWQLGIGAHASSAYTIHFFIHLITLA